MKAKPIQVVPTPEVSVKIEELAKLLRTSKGGFCEIAAEFVIPKIQSGEMALVNGRLQYTGKTQDSADSAQAA